MFSAEFVAPLDFSEKKKQNYNAVFLGIFVIGCFIILHLFKNMHEEEAAIQSTSTPLCLEKVLLFFAYILK